MYIIPIVSTYIPMVPSHISMILTYVSTSISMVPTFIPMVFHKFLWFQPSHKYFYVPTEGSHIHSYTVSKVLPYTPLILPSILTVPSYFSSIHSYGFHRQPYGSPFPCTFHISSHGFLDSNHQRMLGAGPLICGLASSSEPLIDSPPAGLALSNSDRVSRKAGTMYVALGMVPITRTHWRIYDWRGGTCSGRGIQA